jgi:hypothetical protein
MDFLIFYSEEAWLILSCYIKCQNNRFWSRKVPQAVHDVPLHYMKAEIWYAVSARRVIGPVTLCEILSPFFGRLDVEGKLCGVLFKIMQNHTLLTIPYVH